MDSLFEIVKLIIPLVLTFIVQGVKKVVALNGYVALAVVFVIGGIGAIVGVGPVVNDTWVDTTVNAGYIIGLATFIYSLIKKRIA